MREIICGKIFDNCLENFIFCIFYIMKKNYFTIEIKKRKNEHSELPINHEIKEF